MGLVLMLTWDEFAIPVLRVVSDGVPHRRRDIITAVADAVGVTEEERAITLASGDRMYANRISWAVSYLAKVDAIESPQRAQWQITDKGCKLLQLYPNGITTKQLLATAEDISPQPDFSKEDGTQTAAKTDSNLEESTLLDPLEQIEDGIERNHRAVAAELLERLHKNDPEFFEQAVLDLLLAMGYGGSFGRAVHTQLTNDGGIDGVIDQDALGLSRIYVQAKRYATNQSIGRPDIQGFVGALQGEQANQGVFLTTASFTRSAREYAKSVHSRVVLIDGPRLARLMIRYGVGVQVKQTVEVVEVDEDFFE